MASFETKRRCRRLVNDSVFSDRKLTGHEFAGRSCRINSRRFVPSSEVYGQKPVTLPPGRLRLPTMPSNGIAADREHDGYRCRRRLGRQYRRITALRHNERHMAAYEFCRQCGKAIVVTLRPAVFDRDVLAFDVAGFLQTLAERANEVRIRSGRSAMKITDHWNNRSLRARRQRPRRRAAECSQQFPPSDSNCHTPLPCEVRKGTVSRHERRVFFTFKERAETARGAVTRYARGSPLLELDVGRPDHLAPLLGFFANESSKFVRRGWKCRRTQFGDPSLDPGIAKRRVDLLVEFVDDFGRCVLRSAEATPSAGLVPRQKVGNGWDIR